jgi:hypothetical protein
MRLFLALLNLIITLAYSQPKARAVRAKKTILKTRLVPVSPKAGRAATRPETGKSSGLACVTANGLLPAQEAEVLKKSYKERYNQ